MNDCELIIESFVADHPDSYNMKMPNSLVEAYTMYEDLMHTNYGSSTMDEATNKYYLHRINERITQLTNEQSKYIWPYTVAPYFTEEEIDMYKGFYYDEHVGAIQHHSSGDKTLHKRIIDLREELKNTNDPDEIVRIKRDLEALGVTNFDDAMNEVVASDRSKRFEPISWDKKIRTLMTQLKGADDPEDIAFYKQQIVDLGWNPEVEYTAENKLLAKKRIETIYQEQCAVNPILDIEWLIENTDIDNVISEATKEEIKPIHIVLIKGNRRVISEPVSKVTHSDFSHAALCIDNDFNKLYSYNMMNGVNQFTGGFSVESVSNMNKDKRLAIFTFFVKKPDWDAIKARITMLAEDIKNTAYSIVNILTLPFKRININKPESMICSQFVDSTLKMAHIDITGKNSSKVTPETLYSNASSNGKIYKVFDGVAGDFDAEKTQKYATKMAKKAKPYNESTNWVTNLMEDYLYPVVYESKFPVEVNDKGDVLITNPKVDFDAEYSASHKLLMQYDKVKNVESMKYELARLYYMNYVLEKRIHNNRYSKDKKKNTKTRARILNDFNKYMQVLLKLEPGFNFSEYYEKSVFYPHTVEIKSGTVLKLKDVINYIL